MKKMARPASLSLALPKHTSPVSSNITSPTDEGSTSPSPRHLHTSNAENPQPLDPPSEDQLNSPDFTSLPPFPSSPKDSPTHASEPSKGFFSNMKASKSSNKVYHMEPTIRHVSEDTARSNAGSTEKSLYSLRKTTGSTPDLSLLTLQSTSTDDRQGRLSIKTLWCHLLTLLKVVKSRNKQYLAVQWDLLRSQIATPPPALPSRCRGERRSLNLVASSLAHDLYAWTTDPGSQSRRRQYLLRIQKSWCNTMALMRSRTTREPRKQHHYNKTAHCVT